MRPYLSSVSCCLHFASSGRQQSGTIKPATLLVPTCERRVTGADKLTELLTDTMCGKTQSTLPTVDATTQLHEIRPSVQGRVREAPPADGTASRVTAA